MRFILLLFFLGAVQGHGTYVNVGGQHAVPGRTQYQTNQYQQEVQSAPGNQYFRLGQDGSYDFGYDTGSGAYKNEQKSASGQVVGKYGHSNPDGSYTNVQYQEQSGGGGGGALYSNNYGESGSGTYQAVQYGHTLPVQPGRSSETAQATYDRKPDGSYNFNVQSRDQSRVESGTADGQIQGGFSFVADDGVQRSVSYTAGQQGFQAVGDHLPTDSNTLGVASGGAQKAYSSASYAGATSGRVTPYIQASNRQSTYRGTTAAVAPNNFGHQTSTQYRTSGVLNRNLVAPSYGTDKGGRNSGYHSTTYHQANPKPFSFSYNAGDHGRQESQDASGVVRGSYVVNGADGKQKELTYQADDDGFRIVDEKVVDNLGGAAGSYGGGTGSYVTGGGGTVVSGGYSQTGRTAYGSGHHSAASRYSSGQKYQQKSIHSGATAY